jgi:hypothetical protein
MAVRSFLTIFLLSTISLAVIGQELTQNIKGRVTDQLTGKGIEGVNVRVEKGSLISSAQTDASGNFKVNVNVGRYRLNLSHTSYQPIVSEVLVIAGKESVVNFALKENPVMLKEVEVSGSAVAEEVAGERSLTIEKTLRIPANFFDPVRVATAYPGVVSANDQGNSIIIRGNSPTGLLWRLNGADIVNPNHLANAGTLSDKPMANGGGVSRCSIELVSTRDICQPNMAMHFRA